MAIRAPTNLENCSSMRRPLTVATLCRASVDTSFLLEKAVLRGGLDKALRRSLSTAWSRSFEDLTNQSHICCAKSKESHTLSKLFNRSSPPIIYGQTEILPQYGGQYPQNDSSGYFGLTITTRQITSGVESGRACGKCTEPDICNSASDWAADHYNTVYWEGGWLETWHRQLLYVPHINNIFSQTPYRQYLLHIYCLGSRMRRQNMARMQATAAVHIIMRNFHCISALDVAGVGLR